MFTSSPLTTLSYSKCLLILFLENHVNFTANITIKMFQGTETMPGNPNYLDPAFFTRRPIYNVQPQCFLDSTSRVHIQVSFFEGQKGISF